MSERVIDASVIAAIVFEEPEAEAAERAINGAAMYAPNLLVYELSNTAWKKALRHPNLKDDIESALARSRFLGITMEEIDEIEVLRLALKTRITVYDAAYLWLAQERLLSLVTFDRKMQQAAAGLGLTVHA